MKNQHSREGVRLRPGKCLELGWGDGDDGAGSLLVASK